MALSLVVGPAHAGKVALLLERYLAAIERAPGEDPWLIVPNRFDVERVERDLLRRSSALLAGHIGTFDDLFEHIVRDDPARNPVATETQRALAIRNAIANTKLDALSGSAGSEGFADALVATLGEVESGLVDPSRLEGDLGQLAAAYRDELDRLGFWDRNRLRAHAADRLSGDFAAWSGVPVFAYGFEDLTGAEWILLEALSARADVTVSIPYEPGRAAFASLERTVEDLAGLAAGAIEELSPSVKRTETGVPQALIHLERELFADTPPAGPQLEGTLGFLEGAGIRGTAELVAAEVLELLRRGTQAERPADSIAIVCDSIDRWQATLDTVFVSLGIPFALEQPSRLGETTFGRALLGLLRFAWLGGRRGDLFRFLRSPFSGLERRSVDFVEGRLRGRAIADPERVVEESEKLRGAPLPALDLIRDATEPVSAIRSLVRAMARNAWGLEAPPTTDDARADARAYQAILRTLDDLDVLARRAETELEQSAVVSALERTTVRPVAAGDTGYVSVLDYRRARTREFDVVILLGLEEGSFPRRDRPSPFLDDDLRRALGGRLERVDSVSRDRYLFYTACTRATRKLVLAREAATDDGVPREPSPFWEDVRALFDHDEVARATQRRPLSSLTWPLESAPSERERLRAISRLSASDGESATALASANGWTRRLDRALSAFERDTELVSPAVLGWLGTRTTFGVTELERFADCSSAWLVERVIDPKRIDAGPDPILRGMVVHTALRAFYAQLPKEVGADRVTPENLDASLAHVRRCLDAALESGVKLDLTDLQGAELRQTLIVDLEGFVRDEAQSQVAFDPRRLEVAFGSERAAPELQRGLPLGGGLTLSGKIDRIDVDPFSARGIVQDYKSGTGAPSAREIDREKRLQIPLYVLVLRDLVGIEPLGGVYRALAGRRVTRGLLRSSAREDLPGFTRDDYLDDDAFWAQAETARDRATEFAERIRAGDVQHDPKHDECPTWCDLWPMCRVKRA